MLGKKGRIIVIDEKVVGSMRNLVLGIVLGNERFSLELC